MIKEDFLQYLWKNKLLYNDFLTLSNGEILQIISYGEYNTLSGPDFFNARLKIGTQEWAGNVEMHIRSSLWYAHGHETDPAYGNVILHIVWEHDIEVFDYQQNIIPTLELKNYISPEIVQKYLQLLGGNSAFVPCENQLKILQKSLIDNWLEKIYITRLEEKSERIFAYLQETQNDWEAVFFRLLMRNFGGNINGEAFEQVAKSIPFSVIRKELHTALQLEALLFGQLQLIPTEKTDAYVGVLQKEYTYQKQKYQLNSVKTLVQFFKLRPQNFPTIRISQIANLYEQYRSLFSLCLELHSLNDFCKLLRNISTSDYWKKHYTFGKESDSKEKKISKIQAQLLWINTIIPMRFAYAKSLGKPDSKLFIDKMKSVVSEENTITEKFEKIGFKSQNACQSQALIQLYNTYCEKKKCLQCDIGKFLLKN